MSRRGYARIKRGLILDKLPAYDPDVLKFEALNWAHTKAGIKAYTKWKRERDKKG